MKHFQCNRFDCNHLHEHAATFTSAKHRTITCHFLTNMIGFAALYIFIFFSKQQRHQRSAYCCEWGEGRQRLWPFHVHGRTISSLSDSEEVWLTETAQVIEVSTAAIYQAICGDKDDKLFLCSNQFVAISGCHMSCG